MAGVSASCEKTTSGRACGVLAVGRCRRCGDAFCVSHQSMLWVPGGGYSGVPAECADCARSEERRQREQAAADQRATVQAREAWGVQVRRDLATRPRLERYARCLMTCETFQTAEFISLVYPELANRATPWSPREVAHWFLTHQGRPLPLTYSLRREDGYFTGRRRVRRLAAWRAPTTTTWESNESTYQVWLYITPDGRLLSHCMQLSGELREADPQENFSQKGLADLGAMLDLPAVPSPPR